MKISMSMIEQWITKYEPVATIVDDGLTISSIRLFSYEKKPDPGYLYIGRNKDFFDRSTSSEILLVHRKNVISLNTQELEDVFDAVMDAFAFYQEWEQKLLASFSDPNPEKKIIEACRSIFGPMFFMTSSLQVTAFSSQYPKGSINQNWDDFLELGTLSFESLERMKGSAFMKRFASRWECEVFEEKIPGGEYPWSMMISQVNAANTLTGQLMIISPTPFGTWQKQLAGYIHNILCMVAGHKTAVDNLSVVHSLFADFLSDKNITSVNMNTVYELRRWKKDQFFLICFVWKKNSQSAVYRYYEKSIRGTFPQLLICRTDELSNEKTTPYSQEGLILCIPLEKSEDKKKTAVPFLPHYAFCTSPDPVLKQLEKLNLSFSCSFPMEGLSFVCIQYHQALSACMKEKSYYYDCALYDLVSPETEYMQRQLSLHPVLKQIKLYDLEHKTDFYEILKCYLRNERDRGQTARELFIHKNTLVYRLEKMERIFALTLEDSYEREFLLVSIRALEPLIND